MNLNDYFYRFYIKNYFLFGIIIIIIIIIIDSEYDLLSCV